MNVPDLLRITDHRPWPLPSRPWSVAMSWLDLAFIHYQISPVALRPYLPAGLSADTFDGSAWIGIVPFRMAAVRPRGLPATPLLSSFPEVNVRTYVVADGKPGVWFFSLDAASRPTVFAGRRFFDLPYHRARMQLRRTNDTFDFTSLRANPPAVFRARYRPVGDPAPAAPSSFEHWAAERYCLYAHSPRNGLRRLEVHHPPWPLQRAEIEVADNTLLDTARLQVHPQPPRCHFSAGVDVLSFNPVRLSV